ncbi:hypothetical protein [Thermopolyspora flexuosa]|nr:hypothetical protein [Thermopolyspora flexuosa]
MSSGEAEDGEHRPGGLAAFLLGYGEGGGDVEVVEEGADGGLFGGR